MNQLLAENKKYQALFENSITGLFVTRPDGTILEANNAACKTFGYTVEEFRKLGRKGIIDPKSPGLSEKLHEREEGGSTSGTLLGIRKNGEHFWFEFSSSVFEGPGGEKLSSVMMIDVSDKVEAQEKLQGVMNNVPGVVFRYVMETDGSDHLQFVSNGSKEVWGYSPEEIHGDLSKVWANFHKDDVDNVLQSIRESAETNSRWYSEYRYHHPDGSLRWCRGVGDPVRNENGRVVWDSIVLDVTDEKQAEINLKLMESVVTGANDAVLITKAEPVEAPNGPEIIYVNESFEKLTGYKAEEVIGKTPRMLQGPYTESDELQKLRQAIRNREATEAEVLNYNKDGGEYRVHISLNPIFKDGVCTHFISIQRDITERKLREIQKSLSSEISLIFNREETVKKALRLSLTEILKLKQFDAVEFWKTDRDRQVLNLVAHETGNPEIFDFYKKTNQVEEFKKGEGLPGKTWKKKENLFWRNLDKRKTFIRREEAAKAGLKTAFSFPAIEGDEALGVLVLLLSEDLEMERYYVDLFVKLSDQLASEIKRKKLEEELFRIFNYAPDVICIAGLDGYFKKVNSAMSELLGYTEKELLNTPIIDFVHPADKKKTEDEFEALNRGEGNHYFENRHITKSGKVIWLSWTTKPFYDEGITYSVAKDITEEKELRELLDQANRLAKIGSWEVDLINYKVYWTDITREIHEEEPGFEPDFDAGLNYFKEGEARKRIQQAVEETMKYGIPWDLELLIITGKGNERWIRTIGEAEMVNAKPVRIYGSFQDIHKQKVAELKLQEHTRHINAIASLNSALLNYENWYEALETHLMEIGEAVRSDRVYYFENRFDPETGEGFTTQKLEWCRDGITPQMTNPDLEELPFTDVPELVDPMFKGRPSMASLSEVDENTVTRYVMEDQDIKTFLAIPLLVQGVFYGFVGFDNCTVESKWSDEEIRTLKTITSNLAVAIERDQTENERKKLLEEKNRILESIDDGFFTLNRNWIVTYWNSKAEELLQTPKEKILGENLWNLFDDAVDLPSYKYYHKAMNEGISVSFEDYYEPIDRWFDINAYPSDDGISVYFKDITKRKENEEKIRQINERFEKVTKATNDAIWDFDVQNDNLYWGKGFDSLFGYDLTKTNPSLDFLMSLIHPDDRKRVIQKINNYMSDASKTDWFEEYKFQRADGSYAFVMDRAVFITNNNGEVTRVVGAMTDLTRQKEFEESLKKLNIELEQRAKELAASNAELEQFAFVASHDLQEPLRMITSFLAQLERKYDDVLDEKGKKYIRFATDGAKRMRQIILDLLDYSRVGRIDTDRDEVDVNEILDTVKKLHKKKIEEKKATVIWEDMPVIRAASGPMQQLFQNLINNALNYHEKGKRPVVKIWAEESEGHWKFFVQDNGIGIDPQYTDKIFNIFQRLHGRDEYSGTGVGLAICKKIVEEHGGIIGVDSVPGEGSTFYFSITNNQREIIE